MLALSITTGLQALLGQLSGTNIGNLWEPTWAIRTLTSKYHGCMLIAASDCIGAVTEVNSHCCKSIPLWLTCLWEDLKCQQCPLSFFSSFPCGIETFKDEDIQKQLYIVENLENHGLRKAWEDPKFTLWTDLWHRNILQKLKQYKINKIQKILRRNKR